MGSCQDEPVAYDGRSTVVSSPNEHGHLPGVLPDDGIGAEGDAGVQDWCSSLNWRKGEGVQQ